MQINLLTASARSAKSCGATAMWWTTESFTRDIKWCDVCMYYNSFNRPASTGSCWTRSGGTGKPIMSTYLEPDLPLNRQVWIQYRRTHSTLSQIPIEQRWNLSVVHLSEIQIHIKYNLLRDGIFVEIYFVRYNHVWRIVILFSLSKQLRTRNFARNNELKWKNNTQFAEDEINLRRKTISSHAKIQLQSLITRYDEVICSFTK